MTRQFQFPTHIVLRLFHLNFAETAVPLALALKFLLKAEAQRIGCWGKIRQIKGESKSKPRGSQKLHPEYLQHTGMSWNPAFAIPMLCSGKNLKLLNVFQQRYQSVSCWVCSFFMLKRCHQGNTRLVSLAHLSPVITMCSHLAAFTSPWRHSRLSQPCKRCWFPVLGSVLPEMVGFIYTLLQYTCWVSLMTWSK
jgi:hypothetical protein